MKKVSALIAVCFVLSMAFIACQADDGKDDITAVTNITGVPETGVVGTPVTLSGTVAPADATNKTIVWSTTTTGASITDGNKLNATAAGTVTVTATIANGIAKGKNFTADFPVTFTNNVAFVAVTDITGVRARAVVGETTLTGTVEPTEATNDTIAWTVKTAGTTGASITDGNKLNATAAGTVTVTATIADGTAVGTDYAEDFEITITDSLVAVTGITGVPETGVVGTPVTLTGTVAPTGATNKTIAWSVKTAGTTGATITESNKLNATARGTVTVTATITNGIAVGTNYVEDFDIVITNPLGGNNFEVAVGVTYDFNLATIENTNGNAVIRIPLADIAVGDIVDIAFDVNHNSSDLWKFQFNDNSGNSAINDMILNESYPTVATTTSIEVARVNAPGFLTLAIIIDDTLTGTFKVNSISIRQGAWQEVADFEFLERGLSADDSAKLNFTSDSITIMDQLAGGSNGAIKTNLTVVAGERYKIYYNSSAAEPLYGKFTLKNQSWGNVVDFNNDGTVDNNDVGTINSGDGELEITIGEGIASTPLFIGFQDTGAGTVFTITKVEKWVE